MRCWIRWAKANFKAAVAIVHWEVGTRQRYGIGPVDEGLVAEGVGKFHSSARQLQDHLAGRAYLLDSGQYCADFRMASDLPCNAGAGLPLRDYPAVAAWYARREALPYWADPLVGLDAPELPPVPGRS